MNYRHAFHAGNFADVLKHAVLALVITYLKHKDTAFRVIDTHAGCGLYDLASTEAEKTGEWREGIGRLLGPDAEPIPGEVAPLLAPYLDVIQGLNADGALKIYPGSPALARALLRRQDRLVANELHPVDVEQLRAALARDARVKVLAIDAWTALKSLLPPKERRGVTLVDPPFEQAGEMERLSVGLADALRRFATGTYLLWYPIKDLRQVEQLKTRLEALRLPKAMMVELLIRAPKRTDVLNGCGLAIVNAPHTLSIELDVLLPFLAERLAQGDGSSAKTTMLHVTD